MTLPSEEKTSLFKTKQFLKEVSAMRLTDIRNNSRQIREWARECLHHYPLDIYIEKLYRQTVDEDQEDKDLLPIFQYLGDFLENLRIDYIAGSTNNANVIDWDQRIVEIEQILDEIDYKLKD